MTGFKPTTIKRVLRKKLESIAASFADEKLSRIFLSDSLICGGSITSLMQGETPNDYDVYFKSMDTAEVFARYYASIAAEMSGKKVAVERYTAENTEGKLEDRLRIRINSSGIAELEDVPDEEDLFANDQVDHVSVDNVEEVIPVIEKMKKTPYRLIYVTDNAITLSNKVQIILRFQGNKDTIYRNFDFLHTNMSYNYQLDELDYNKDTLSSVMSKTLVYNGSLYPLASLIRLRKFIQRGWRVSAGQILKIAFQVNKLDLENKRVLQEQLIGVDQTFMDQLYRQIGKSDSKVDDTYIAQLIDKIFGDSE